MTHVRAHIRFETVKDATNFVSQLNADGTTNKYVIENSSCSIKIDARSLLGVIYAMTDFNDDTYFVNSTEDGVFPSFINQYRV